MAKRNDFMEGFLRGLYNSGVGNPEVQRANQAATDEQQATLNAKFAEKGMVPGPDPTVVPAHEATMPPGVQGPGNLVPASTLPQDHPVTQKIGSFISSLFGGPSKPLQTLYHKEPDAVNYYQKPNGETGYTMGKTPIPIGAAEVPKDKGPTLLAATGKLDRTNIPFDTARSMAILAQKPQAFDTMIATAQSQGRDYITKDEMNTAMGAIKTGSWQERADFYKQQAEINRQRLDLSKRVATYGGKMGQGQQAINTAIGHLGDAMDAMVELGNTDVNALNRPINEIGKKTNDGSIIAAGINLTALQSELASAYKGGGATDQEIAAWKSSLNTDLTPQQWLAAATKTSQLLTSKISSFGYQQGLINPDVAGKSPLSPSAKSSLEKIKAISNGSASQASGKPRSVIQNGHTYTLNPLTGKYE